MGLLDQGAPEFFGEVMERTSVAHSFNLEPSDLHSELPLEVVSTGLRYLIVPVLPRVLQRARILQNLTNLLHGLSAQFAVLFDGSTMEMRHWNNDGVIEDIATGSAAGTVGAYLLRHGLAQGGDEVILHRGRFVDRPSQVRVMAEGTSELVNSVKVGGDVAIVGSGRLDTLPDAGS